MNRIEQAYQWVNSLSAEQYQQKLKEAKAKYKQQLKPQVMAIMQKQLPKTKKQLQVNRLFLTTMYLEKNN